MLIIFRGSGIHHSARNIAQDTSGNVQSVAGSAWIWSAEQGDYCSAVRDSLGQGTSYIGESSTNPADPKHVGTALATSCPRGMNVQAAASNVRTSYHSLEDSKEV